MHTQYVPKAVAHSHGHRLASHRYVEMKTRTAVATSLKTLFHGMMCD